MKIKPLFFLLCFFFSTVSSFSQPQSDLKRDYQWILGYNSIADFSKAVIFDFNHDSLELYETTKLIPISQSYAGLCDKDGNLMLYSNACSIADSSHQVIPNGDTINFSNHWDEQCNDIIHHIAGYVIYQDILMLPVPNRDDQVYAFHKPLRETEFYDNVFDVLFLTKIQKNTENQWVVTEKDIPIMEDFLMGGNITACRHANGRDWWVITPKGWDTNKYYTWLLTEDGLSGPFEQQIGEEYLVRQWEGASLFSPDGSKYVLFTKDLGVNIFDFDRCTGTLSNPIQFPFTVWGTIVGAAISPNSRYLYLSFVFHVWQFDLWAADIPASKVVVAEYDNFYNEGSVAYLEKAQLAPDGKIYINAYKYGKRVMHVIEQPDSAGVACHVVQHKIVLPVYTIGLPQYPNFRLGPLTGSPCDTLTEVVNINSSRKYSFSVSPNPASGQLILENLGNADGNIVFYIYNAQGLLMRQSRLKAGVTRKTIDTAVFPSGFYFYEFVNKEKVIDSGKIIFIHE